MKLLPLLPSPSGSPYQVAEAGYQCVSNAEANKQLNNSNETQRLKDRAESSIVCACVGSATTRSAQFSNGTKPKNKQLKK